MMQSPTLPSGALMDRLRAEGLHSQASRLQRCSAARLGRRHGAPWPFRCRLVGCPRCGPALIGKWASGLGAWASQQAACPLLIRIPPEHPSASLDCIARRFRRALRDLRDRAAHRDRRWSSVAIVGLVDPDRVAHLLVVHPHLSAGQVERMLRRRWPKLMAPGRLEPPTAMRFTPEDAAYLLRLRRGVEPLRIAVMAQRRESVAKNNEAPPAREPMPFVVG